MTRRIAWLALVLLAVAGTAVAVGARGDSTSAYRVDALFDNADYLVGGQQVKVAGAVVGKVTAVRLTPDHKARVEMEIASGFAPFRSDASCEIRPESLIGEKFIQCYPGSPAGHELVASGGHAPTVPLANDHSPVDVDLVLSALRLPWRERLSIIVAELGTGLAGRPADLDAAIRRANPALQQARRVLTILDSDRRTLGALVDASDRVIAELARHRGDVASFIARANTVAQAVAGHRGDLGEAIRRMPALLDRLRPAAVELTGFAREALPVAGDLRASALPVRNLLGDVRPLTSAALPTLVKVDQLAVTGRRAVRVSEPVAAALAPVASALPPLGSLARVLLEAVQARGALEGLGKFFYYTVASEARFDRFSHIVPSYQVSLPSCQQFATAPVAGCDSHWGGHAKSAGPASVPPRPAHGRSTQAQAPRAAPAATRPSAPAAPRPAPSASAPAQTPEQLAQQLLRYLVAP